MHIEMVQVESGPQSVDDVQHLRASDKNQPIPSLLCGGVSIRVYGGVWEDDVCGKMVCGKMMCD